MAAESSFPAAPGPAFPASDPGSRGSRRRVRARVALSLLEALRDQDRPGEILDDENVTVTLPRRFGLSAVVRAQITHYEQETRRGRTVPEAEVVDLMRLVARRPDAYDVFHHVGRSLTAADRAPAWRRVLPARLNARMARRRIQRRLRHLFGRGMIRPVPTGTALEAGTDTLLRGDPGGEACALVTGLCEAILEVHGLPGPVQHVACRARGEDRCVWSLAGAPAGAGAGESEADSSGPGGDPAPSKGEHA